jgi:hypothetical protein
MLGKVVPLLAGGLVGLIPLVSLHRPAIAELICGTGYYLSLGQCVLVPTQPFVVAPVGLGGGAAIDRGRYGAGAVSGPNGAYGVRGPGGATYVHTENRGSYYRR